MEKMKLSGLGLINAAMSESLVTKERLSEARTVLKRMVDGEISVKEAADYFEVTEIIMLQVKVLLTGTTPLE